VASDLEQRRRAIVHALRATSPLPADPVTTERVQDLEHALAEVRLALAHCQDRIDTLESDRAAAEPPLDRSGSVTPGLDFRALMSPVASRALFGHT
jgi:hypothetical protein